MRLATNYDSVFLLYHHLVLITKCHRQVIDNEISEYTKAIFERISKSYHIILVEWKGKDHIHIILKVEAKTVLTKFFNAYKSASFPLIKGDFPIVKHFLKRMFWSKSFYLLLTAVPQLIV